MEQKLEKRVRSFTFEIFLAREQSHKIIMQLPKCFCFLIVQSPKNLDGNGLLEMIFSHYSENISDKYRGKKGKIINSYI